VKPLLVKGTSNPFQTMYTFMVRRVIYEIYIMIKSGLVKSITCHTYHWIEN